MDWAAWPRWRRERSLPAEMRVRVDRRLVKLAAAVLLVSALFLTGMLLLRFWEEGRILSRASGDGWTEEESGALLFYEGEWYAPRADSETVLVLGLDRSESEEIPEYGAYAQADFLLLLEIDRAAGVCTPVLLNRDTMADIPDFDEYGRPSGTCPAQLALAYAHAQAYTGNRRTACRAAVEAVSSLLYGVSIDHYVTLTMDGLMALNDLAGGVTVEVRDDFSAVDSTLVQGERVTLMGEHALNYVRARWWVGDSSNLERMERQKEYLSGLQERLSALADQDEEFVLDSLLEISEHMSSDCTAEQLAQLAEEIRGFRMEDYVPLEGETVMGETYVEFHVDEAALQRLVIEVFYQPAEED